MATKVSDTTLTIRQSEDINLMGQKYGGTKTRSVSGCDEVIKRIVTVAESSNMANNKFIVFGSTASEGTVIVGNFKYARITNLDTANSVVLTLANEAGTNMECSFLLQAGESFILNNTKFLPDSDGTLAADKTDSSSLVDIEYVAATGIDSTTSVDCEVLVVSG